MDKFVGLTEAILNKNKDVDVWIIAGKDDVALLDAFKNLDDCRLHTFIGKTSLQETAAFLKTCDAFVTCTSSPQHIAGAMDVPTTSITYPWSYKLWTPRGPHNACAVSQKNGDVRDIPVEEVYQALNRTLCGLLEPL